MTTIAVKKEDRVQVEKDHPGLMDWLLTGERGLSSEAIVKVVLGIPFDMWGNNVPLDAGDFRRCALLFQAVPTLRPLLDTVVAESDPAWALLAENWDLLTEIFIAAIPNYLTPNPDWNKRNKALSEAGYNKIQALLKEGGR